MEALLPYSLLLLPVLAPSTARLNLTYFFILLINIFKGSLPAESLQKLSEHISMRYYGYDDLCAVFAIDWAHLF